MASKPLLLTQDIAREILDNLTDGSPPFIALAAERAGITREQVKNWIRYGEENHCPLRTPFARAVRKIRAEWVSQQMARMLQVDKQTAEQARQINWTIERLERDLMKPPIRDYMKPEKEKPAAPAPPAAPPTEKELGDLAEPEGDRVH